MNDDVVPEVVPEYEHVPRPAITNAPLEPKPEVEPTLSVVSLASSGWLAPSTLVVTLPVALAIGPVRLFVPGPSASIEPISVNAIGWKSVLLGELAVPLWPSHVQVEPAVRLASASEFTPPPPSIDTGTGIGPPLTSRVMLSSLVSELVIVRPVIPAVGTIVWLRSTVIE